MRSKPIGRAMVTEAFDGVPDGTAVARRYRVGDVVVGELAGAVVKAGWAVAEGPVDVEASAAAPEASPPALPPASAPVAKPTPPQRRPREAKKP